jgi:hypothetical protein
MTEISTGLAFAINPAIKCSDSWSTVPGNTATEKVTKRCESRRSTSASITDGSRYKPAWKWAVSVKVNINLQWRIGNEHCHFIGALSQYLKQLFLHHTSGLSR